MVRRRGDPTVETCLDVITIRAFERRKSAICIPDEMQSATASSVSRIESIGKTIAEMSLIATAIATAVEQQGSATLEIARNVQEAARGTGEVSANISGVRQAASETGAAAS